MAKNPVVELERFRKKVAALESKVAKQNLRLLALPRTMGFKTVNDLVAALKSAAKTNAVATAETQAKGKTRKRAKITPAIEAKVKALVAKGMTGIEISKEVKISMPSVANIKKKLGLVRKAE